MSKSYTLVNRDINFLKITSIDWIHYRFRTIFTPFSVTLFYKDFYKKKVYKEITTCTTCITWHDTRNYYILGYSINHFIPFLYTLDKNKPPYRTITNQTLQTLFNSCPIHSSKGVFVVTRRYTLSFKCIIEKYRRSYNTVESIN